MAEKVRPKSPLNSVSLKEELAAALAARRELGEQYEDHVAAALAERIDSLIDQRVQAAMDQTRKQAKSDSEAFLKVAMPVLGFGVPLTIVGAIVAGAERLLRRTGNDLRHQCSLAMALAIVMLRH